MSEVVLVSLNIPGNDLDTMIQRIIAEVSRASDDDTDAIKRALISSIRYFRDHRFWFNEGTHTFTLTVDDQDYEVETASTEGPPSDWIRPVTAYLKQGDTRWLEMNQVSINEMRYLTPTDTTTGLPTDWAWFNNTMYFSPIPSQADDVRFDYVRDIGTPSYYWDGTEWKFTSPEGSDLLGSWTSDWFIKAEELIRSRTKWDLYYHYYDDDNMALKMGGTDGLGGAVGIAYNAAKKTDSTRHGKQRRRSIVI